MNVHQTNKTFSSISVMLLILLIFSSKGIAADCDKSALGMSPFVTTGEPVYDHWTGYWFVGAELKLGWNRVLGAAKYCIYNNNEYVFSTSGTSIIIHAIYGSGRATTDVEAIENMTQGCWDYYNSNYTSIWSVKAVCDLSDPCVPGDSIDIDPVPTPDIGKEECPEGTDAASGTSVSTKGGNVYSSDEDYSSSDRSLSLRVTRSYNSQSSTGILGKGWLLNYEMKVEKHSIPGGKYAVTVDKDGKRVRYDYANNKYFTGENDKRYTGLIENPDGTFEESTWQNLKYKFNSSGKLTEIEDHNDNKLTLTYTSGKLTTVTDPDGLSLHFYYNASGLLERITTPSDLELRYSYDPSYRLIAVIKSSPNDGTITTRYEYDDDDLLIKKIDPNGNELTWSYDKSYNPAKCTGHEGSNEYLKTAITYYNNSTLVQYKRETGDWQWYTYYYDEDTRQLTKIVGPISTTENPGITTYFEYDSNGNMISKTVAHPAVPSYYLKTKITYDSRHNLMSIITEKVASLRADPAGTPTTYTYDLTYNLVTSTTDPSGRETQYTYDSDGNRTRIRKLDGEGGHIDVDYTYYDNGQLKTVTNSKGTTTYTYDSYGNLDMVIPPIGEATDYDYNARGQLESVTLPGSRTTTHEWDDFGRMTKVIYPPANPGDEALFATSTYDEDGNRTSFTDTAGRTTTYGYSTFDNLLTSVTRTLNPGATPTPVTVNYGYNLQGQRTTITDPLGRNVAEYTYGALNQPISIKNIENQDEDMEYYPDGSIQSKLTAGGIDISYLYDSRNRLEAITYPDDIIDYTYLENGLQDTISDDSGMIDNDYDDYNRLESIDGPLTDDTISYTYCDCGAKDSMTTPSGTTSYDLDALNRVNTITNEYNEETTFTYDSVTGNLDTMTYHNGVSCGYTYDNLNRLTSMEWKNTSQQTLRKYDYEYDDAGMRTKITREDNTYTAYSYDSLDRLTNEEKYSAASDLFTENTYEYDVAENRTKKIRDGGTVTYTNTLNKCMAWSYSVGGGQIKIPVAGSADETIASGNVNDQAVDINGQYFSTDYGPLTPTPDSQSITAIIQDTAGNEGTDSINVNLNIIDRTTYSYDSEGNLQSKSEGPDTWTYIWNDRNRLTEIKLNDVTNLIYSSRQKTEGERRGVGEKKRECNRMDTSGLIGGEVGSDFDTASPCLPYFQGEGDRHSKPLRGVEGNQYGRSPAGEGLERVACRKMKADKGLADLNTSSDF